MHKSDLFRDVQSAQRAAIRRQFELMPAKFAASYRKCAKAVSRHSARSDAALSAIATMGPRITVRLFSVHKTAQPRGYQEHIRQPAPKARNQTQRKVRSVHSASCHRAPSQSNRKES